MASRTKMRGVNEEALSWHRWARQQQLQQKAVDLRLHIGGLLFTRKKAAQPEKGHGASAMEWATSVITGRCCRTNYPPSDWVCLEIGDPPPIKIEVVLLVFT